MTYRALLLSAVVWCSVFVRPADAQTGGLASRAGGEIRYHDDEYDAVPAPAKAIDDALADLTRKLSGVKLKSGTLDTEGLSKALQADLQGLKQPNKLKLISSAACEMVDPKDRGGYWSAEDVMFADKLEREHAWQKDLKVDEKKFALSKPPVAELKYSLIGKGFDEPGSAGGTRPFARSVHVHTNYTMVVTVTVTFDAQAVEQGTGGTFSGVGSGAPDAHTFKGLVSLTDRTKPVP